jgi:tetratricopeptide (TPR) repeat protein
VPASETPDRATAIRRELIALRRRQAQLARIDAPERGWELLQQALAMAPGDPVLLNDLTELAEELGRYDDLAELVQSWQAVEGDPSRAMVLSSRRADALLRGGQRDQARALLAGLEASAPGFIVLTSAAERDALGRAHPGDLARTYLAAAHAALLGSWLGPGQPPAPDPHAAAALYVQAAELLAYEVAPGDLPPESPNPVDEARMALGKALEAVPGYPPALEALTELDDTTGDVAEGLERLRTAAAVLDGEPRRALLERAVRLARGHGDLESVLEIERAIASLAPDDLSLRWRIESTLSQLGRDEERAELLAELAATETDATRRGTALLAAARLRERAGAVESATDLYRQVLALWPEDTFARESLIDLLRAQERWTELVSERSAEARALPDGPAARRALREAAWVLEVRLGETADAARVYEEWLQRFGDDRTALEGAARCRAGLGDRLGEVAARRALVELEPSPESQWLYARALERAGQTDDAADVYRALMVREEPSVAATAAAFGLADLAAARGDTVMRVEATAALAARTREPRLGAALAEDGGWMYALVLEDGERAAQSFAAAIALDPTRRGALLGAALVAAKQGDLGSLAGAYEGLASSVQMAEAAAALHLRAAAVAAAAGDVELANARVAAARQAAPDDTSALLVVAEAATTPVVGPGDPEAAIDPLLARAEVLEMRSALADDPASRATWELDRAEALELAGRLREAGAVVVAVLRMQPGDLRALEAMRRMAKRTGDQLVWAQASYQLARVLGDPAAKLALLRDAASVFDAPAERTSAPPGALGAAARERSELSLAIYRRILQVDPGAPELDRLLDLLRRRADVRGLIQALSERLNWLEAEAQDLARDQQMVPHLLERATVLHGLGEHTGAMADLDALLDRAASHAEALRFRADLAFEAGDVELAIALWRRCLAAETRPQRRGEVELQLAKVLAENVNDVAGAIENLEHFAESNPDDVGLRERILALCMRANDWERAVRELKVLARLRPTPQEKAREELRLGIMYRDRLNDRTSARLALDRARTLDPLNLDVVRELAELLESGSRAQLLAATAASFRASIVQNPKSAVLYDRLAQVTAWQSDVDARWLALVGLEALGTLSVEQRQVLEQGRQKLGVPARVKLDPAARKILRGPAVGPLFDLWRAIAPAAQVTTGFDPAKLGFVRGDRLAIKKLGDRYEALASALVCFGIEDLEIYISASRTGAAWALAAETPILCIGADVASGKTPQQRWILGRTVAMIAEGFATLPDLREAELGWTLAAALRAAEVTIPPALAEEIDVENASIADRVRLIRKELSRKERATVQQIAQQRAAELADVAGLRRQALAVGNRSGLVWSGDLAVSLAQLDVGRGGKALIDNAIALELAAWSVSEDHGKLRELLGIGLKGAR